MTDVATPRGNARGRLTRARLLEAAAQTFGDRGYAATRISDIAAAAGMSQGGFYRHFRDKNEILLEVLQGPLERLLAATVPVVESGGIDEESIVAGNTAFFQVYAADRRIIRVLREAGAMHEPGVVDLWLDVRARFIDRIATWLRRLEAEGTLRTTDVDVLADSLGSVLDQVAYTRVALAPRDPTPEEIAALGRVTGEVFARTIAGGHEDVTPPRKGRKGK